MSQIFTETFRYKLTLPTAKAGGFLLQPLLHWMIPCGISMSYTVSTSWIILFPYALRCSFICTILTAFAVLYSRYLHWHWCPYRVLYGTLDTPTCGRKDSLPVDFYTHNRHTSDCLGTL